VHGGERGTSAAAPAGQQGEGGVGVGACGGGEEAQEPAHAPAVGSGVQGDGAGVAEGAAGKSAAPARQGKGAGKKRGSAAAQGAPRPMKKKATSSYAGDFDDLEDS